MGDYVLAEEYERCHPKLNLIQKKYYLLPVSARFGNPLDHETELMYIADTPEHRKGVFIVKVSGDLMFPQFSDGNLALIAKQPTVEVVEIGIFILNILNGKSFIKQLGINEIISINHQYHDKPYTVNDSIKRCGKLICKI